VNEELGKKTAEEIGKLNGGKCLFIKVDVSDYEAVNAAIKTTVEKFGDLDFQVNSAGVLRDAMMAKYDDNKWDFTVKVNLKGVAVCMSAFASYIAAESKKLQEQKGADYKLTTLDHKPRVIVNISSMAADGNVGQLSYSATKAGVIGMTKTAAKELVRYNVRTHAVKPTLIETPIIGDLLQKQEGKFKSMYESRIPFGIGKTEYVSDVVLFLSGKGGYFINGAVIDINGGKLDSL
jgi:3-oxoacyl-[acyl-carrier protein] reductase/2-hydroxycyclohexanecarboxyl-CoA dehydrogenase